MTNNHIALKNLKKINPTSIEDYINHDGYIALNKAITTDPFILNKEIENANLHGRGGAGFPTGLKLKYTRLSCDQCPEFYVICNADEGEPGTFKDRIIMENDPHLLIEGMLIAGYIVGSNKGYIYIRGEYYKAIDILNKAINDAKAKGYLGNNILGSNFSFDIELHRGAGSYLCGEELTLIESLEGKRGNPRIKPPFPAEKGLYNKPTLVNNVETLSHLPYIVLNGSQAYKKLGTEKSSGTKIYCVSGHINKPGYFEFELGISLKELIFEVCGGIKNNLKFKAALLGGAAGTFVDSSMLDIPLSYDTLKANDATLGSGAVIVISENTPIKTVLTSILRFFKHESCGKCVPCRIGCHYLLSMTNDLSKNNGCIEKMISEAEYMAKTSLCPLGQSPILPLKSAYKFFKEELY